MAVTTRRHDVSMLSVMLAAGALVATLLQTKTSAKEVGRANRAAMEWWDAETSSLRMSAGGGGAGPLDACCVHGETKKRCRQSGMFRRFS